MSKESSANGNASDWKSIEVSMVTHAQGTETSNNTVADILDAIRSEEWAREVQAITTTYTNALEAAQREGKDDPVAIAKEAVREAKEKLPGILFSGRFSRRADNAIEEHSGILGLDMDNCAAPAELRTKLTTDKHVLFAFTSPTSSGLKVGVCVKADRSLHAASWAAAKKYFGETYGIIIDEACKNVSRICFVSHDPDIFIREGDAEILEPLEPLKAPSFTEADLVDKCGPFFWTGAFGNITKINQSYIAQRFCLENLVLFEQDEGWFFVYEETDGAWRRVITDAIKHRVIHEWERLVTLFGRQDLHKKINNGAFNAITDIARSICGRTEVFQPLARIIHCANGMLHLGEAGQWELKVFHPDYFARNPTPINWNPEAVAPRFQAILDTLEPEDADLLLRYSANVLLGGNPSQQILILCGEGGTSKSTVCEIMELVAGKRNVAELRTEHLDDRFEIGRYLGKTMLAGKDVKGDFLQHEGAARIKALTGHDSLTGEVKFQMGTPEVYGNFAIVITCNERLTVRLEGDTDMSAWSRRLMVIEFSTKSKHETTIPNYAQKLFAEEGEGILVMIVAAAFQHLEELSTIGTFAQTPTQKARVEELLAESRSIEYFVRERVFKAPKKDVSTDELLTAYNRYCELHGWEPVVPGKFHRQVHAYMSRLYQSNVGANVVRDDRRVRGYPNVDLIEEDDSFSTEEAMK